MSAVFHRPPRDYPPLLGPRELPVPLPPPSDDAIRISWMQGLLPLLGSLGMVGFALIYPNRLFLYVSIGMVVASVLASVGVIASQKRQSKRQARRQRERYGAFLDRTERTLRDAAEEQRRVAERLYPEPARLAALLRSRPWLWERRPHDADFLTVRLGLGDVPALLQPALEEEAAGDPEPRLEERRQAIAAQHRILDRMPIEVGLDAAPVVCLAGPRRRGRALCRAVLAQLAAKRAPDDLRVLAFFDEVDTGEWEFLKWLPHLRESGPADAGDASGGPAVLLASSVEDLGQLLEEQVAPRTDQLRALAQTTYGEEQQRVSAPHLVVVVDGLRPDAPAMELPLLRELLVKAAGLNASVLCLLDDAADEPSESAALVRLRELGPASLRLSGPGGARLEAFAPDELAPEAADELARALAPQRLDDRSAIRSLGDVVRLVDLLGLPQAEDLDVDHAWRPRPRSELLRVPIGLDGAGQPVVLDLKEAAAGGLGPHGLIVGATGSGKSELLRSLVSGLAATHSPELLNFVFIDFKGGAAFADLSALPHVAGMITNLQSDLTMVDRMREALTGEQERRQRLLREAGNLDGIAAYQLARAARPELAPLPYLLVIVDEFGELLASRPEFTELFAALGRVGRSLGINILFSTQRLDEGRIRNLEGHLRYRICLRTFNVDESKTVIGTADAHLLPPIPGAGFLKVDTSVYTRFKCALVTAAARTPTEAAQRVAVQAFAPTRRPARAAEGDEAAVESSDMDVLVAAMRDGGRDHTPAHKVWLPPLEPALTLDQVLDVAGDVPELSAPIGIVDRPARQTKGPHVLDLAGSGGHVAIVGAPQTGKSTLLRSIVLAFAATHTPEQLHVYGIDLGGGTLRSLEALPHVGSICGKLERERMRRTIRYARGLMDERERSFRLAGVESMAEHRDRRARGVLEGEPLPDVLLVIDNLASLRRELDDVDPDLEEIAATGLNYGVHLLLTANRWPELRPALRDNVGGRMELRLNDPADSDFGRVVASTLPTGIPGRVLTSEGLHAQIALPRLDGKARTGDIADAVATAIDGVALKHAGLPGAAPVRLLPVRLARAQLLELTSEGETGIPIGVEEQRLLPVMLDLDAGDPHFLVFGDTESGKTTFIRTVVQGIARGGAGDAKVLLVDYRRRLLDLAASPAVAEYACTPQMLADAVQRLADTLTTRLPPPGASLDEVLGGPTWSGPEWYVVIDDYDLVPGALGSPLSALLDLLAQAREVGLHMVVARRVGGAARASFEPVFQRLRELGSPGLILSGDPQEGPLLGAQRAYVQPPGRGFLVSRHQRPLLVQTPLPESVGAGILPTGASGA